MKFRIIIFMGIWITSLVAPCFSLGNEYAVQADGKLVMTIQKYKKDLNGFRESVGMRGQKKQKKPWWETSTFNIYTLNPDGTDLMQLTEDDMSVRPKRSPDGRLIAYISSPENSQDLYIMNEDGREKKELLSNQAKIYDFWWSPDSSAILVSVETRVSEKPECYVVHVDRKHKERLGHHQWAQGWNHWDAYKAEIVNPHFRLLSALPEGIVWPKWSPYNHYIAFITEGILTIANVEATSATGRWVLQRSEPPCHKIEEWSSDGKILFYANGYVCSAGVEKDRLKNMANLSMIRGWDATWNADGTRIAFISIPAGRSNSEVYVMDADGTNQIRITYTNYNHKHLDWR